MNPWCFMPTPLSRLRSSERKCCAKFSSNSLIELKSSFNILIMFAGISGLLGGLRVVGCLVLGKISLGSFELAFVVVFFALVVALGRCFAFCVAFVCAFVLGLPLVVAFLGLAILISPFGFIAVCLRKRFFGVRHLCVTLRLLPCATKEDERNHQPS
jgi:hypothetical protein